MAPPPDRGSVVPVGPLADAPTRPLPVLRTHRWGFGAYLLCEAVFLLTSVLVLLPFGSGDTGLPPIALVLGLIVPTVLAAGTALVATLVRGNGPRRDLGLVWSWRDLAIGSGLGLAGLVLTVPASAVWAAAVGSSHADSAVGEAFSGLHMSPGLAWTVFFGVLLVAPLCEEIVYRGLLWGAIERRGWNRWMVLGLTTLVFAFAHLELTRTPLLLVIALPIGAARLLTGRLLASVVAHQLNNLLPAVALLLLLLGHG